MLRSHSLLLFAGLFIRQCVAQEAGWQPGQVNSTMCLWDSPRAAVVRDTLYIDGGYLYWQPGMNDGSYGTPLPDGNPLGLVYLLNFSTPFNVSSTTNFSNVFTTISKASNGGAANNIGPQYYDGAMFGNDYGWTTYGGLPDFTLAFRAQPATQVATYQAYPQLADQFTQGYALDQLPDGMTRYVTNGASVSVPSENLGYYLGGLRAATFGPIFYQPGNGTVRANVESTTLISLDMSNQQRGVWANESLPTAVPGRANAELIWVPVSTRGVLVAIGGVINPTFALSNQSNNAAATLESSTQSPRFMETVAVYDIDSKTWYEQPTDGTPPPQLTQGCTVLASSQDGSSHNIYWYGGYNGLEPTQPFSDEVWVLSIPSFTWIRVSTGVPTHGRAGHRCTKPYPDQMLVIGGYTPLSGTTINCVDGGFIQVFNLSSVAWMDSYDPNKWSNYTVPSMISDTIGGSGTGSATRTAPTPSGFANSSMTEIFGTPYNTSKIVNWYPYEAEATSSNNRTTPLPTVVATSSGGTPAYLAPVLGVVLGLFFLTLVGLGILLWRRRGLLGRNRNATQSESGTLDTQNWVARWIRSTPADIKAPTVTTDETPTSPDPYHQPYEDTEMSQGPEVPEMGDSQLYEMADSSRPSELGGFVPLSATKNNKRGHMTHSSSNASQTSSVSRVSQSRPGISPMHTPRADSPLDGDGNRLSHARGISDTSVSTDGGAYATPMDVGSSGIGVGPRPGVVSPMGEEEEDAPQDYLGASGSGSPSLGQGRENRRSNFSEKLDEGYPRK